MSFSATTTSFVAAASGRNSGTYCGYTVQGAAICFDVAGDGRRVSKLEVGVVVRCQPRRPGS